MKKQRKKRRARQQRPKAPRAKRPELSFDVQEVPPRTAADMRELVSSASKDVDRLIEDCKTAMDPFDAYDVIANLIFANLPLDADAYKESEHPGMSAVIELGARLCLERPTRAGNRLRGEELIDGPTIDLWLSNLRGVIFKALFEAQVQTVQESTPMARLQGAVVERELLIRNSSFEHQEKETLASLFGQASIDRLVRGALGFGIEEALAFEDALTQLPSEAMEVMGSGARQLFDELEPQVRAQRRSPREDADDLIRQLAKLSHKRARRLLLNNLIGYVWVGIGDRLQITAEELAARAGLPVETAGRFLDAFSKGFGQSTTDPRAPAVEIRDRPIIQDAEGNYFCTSVGNLLFALRPALTRALKDLPRETKKADPWERFNKARKDYLERRSVTLLAAALRSEDVYTNATTTWNGATLEMDGLIVLDSVAIVVEAKAGALSEPAKAGNAVSLYRRLKSLVSRANEQLVRARSALVESDRLKLRTSEGEVELDTSELTRVLLVAVTLEDLSFVAPTVWDLVHTGLLPNDEEPPILLNLHDLEVMCEVVEPSVLLIHYFLRRLQMNRLELVRASDELDLFMHFLNSGLYFEDVRDEPEPPDAIFMTSLTDELDAYYLWKLGIRSVPAPKPAQQMHAELRRVLDQLDSSRARGFVEASLILLDFGKQGRGEFAKGLARQRRASKRDGEFHDFTIGSDTSRTFVNVMTAPADHVSELLDRLAVYSIAKKNQLRADRWLAFATVAGRTTPFEAYVLNVTPWTEDDPEARRIADELGLSEEMAPNMAEARRRARRLQTEPGRKHSSKHE